MSEVIIRKATSLDIGRILELFNKYLDGANMKTYPAINDYAGIWVSNLIHSHTMIIAELHETIIGMLGFRCVPFLWNDKVFCLSADIFMVDKDYRKSNAAKGLLEAAKELGDLLKLPVICGVMTGMDVELKDRFTKMCGFKYIGGNFIYGEN
jgi:hypothetical protein